MYEHAATDCRDLTQRGEFVYTANGKGGFRMFDIANIDNKAFSERFDSSPVSPLGENLHVSDQRASRPHWPCRARWGSIRCA